ncbi:MAG: CDP-glycerol glycerophosphotransferase family protein [Oscillospiraceae bacterium]|nr:CDP-glycerol glycerophosphotransferase family protein [Oscillospiraceae bacterium]
MRRAVKQSLMEIFSTLYEAHNYIKNFIEKGKTDDLQSLFGDCQQTAIQLGSIIEESEGEGFVTVSHLESYCEAVYEIATSGEFVASKIKKTLDRKLMSAESSAKNDIKVKLEIVFMPYKASMWDSLESVWKAADKDDMCDAYVVPIPYYDKNSDGTLGKFHYEGKEYPDYVPVIHYETYDLSKRRPDVIYIHNPYDEYNFVTSVDPRFYSSELKKYTDCLVYIPYYVSDKNVNAVRTHYVLSAGVINSDKTIVQSPKFADLFKKTLLSQFGDTPENRMIVNDKIQGLGSPKFDAVNTHKKEDYEIPSEWKEIIGDKKVVLYNTHLSMLMKEYYQKFIPKLKEVIEYFRNRDDVVLLWRPHPLTISTAQSMNPEALVPYMEIVNEFKDNKYGIYDDTSDMNRAVAISDAYYGSWSSVIPIYKETGKPVMIQNIDIREDL